MIPSRHVALLTPALPPALTLALAGVALLGCAPALDKQTIHEQLVSGHPSDLCAEHGFYADGVCDDWCPAPDPDCSDPSRPTSDCAASGFFCGGGDGSGACPADARPVGGMVCDPGLVCCESASPPPGNACEAAGNFCASAGSDGMFRCPIDTAEVPGLSCGAAAICCAGSYPPGPVNECESAGNFCATAGSDGMLRCPIDTGEVPGLSCGDGASAICCGGSLPRPPGGESCEVAGHFCAPYGPGTSCPSGTHAVAELACNPAAEEICCVPDAPAVSACEAAGNACYDFAPGAGCPAGTVSVPQDCSVPGGPVLEATCCAPAPSDCRSSGCPMGSNCQACAEPGSVSFVCIPDGAVC